ncbi:MAG: hypothetical protein NTV05_02525 [Acidobacteria bacterium]|nr:hypothetical protein [Acidobacteriota bacterium]
MSRSLVIAVLGLTGAALLVWSETGFRSGPAQVNPFFVMAIVAPIVLRASGIGLHFRQMFANCFAVGLIMGMSFYGWLNLRHPHPSMPLYGHLWRVAFLVACVAFMSAIVAAVASKTPGGGDPIYRRPLFCLAGGYAAFLIVAVGVPVVRSPSAAIHFLNGAFLLGLWFTAVAGVVHLPILLAARRGIKRRRWLALLGAALSPAPMAGLFLFFADGRLWNYWLSSPVMLLQAALPFAAAGAVLGWLLAKQQPKPECVAL